VLLLLLLSPLASGETSINPRKCRSSCGCASPSDSEDEDLGQFFVTGSIAEGAREWQNRHGIKPPSLLLGK
jgi:hypothetical protein